MSSTWESKYDFLVEYAKKERNCKVPQTYTVKGVNLGRWVMEQRTQFEKMKNGEKSSLIEEKINALNNIGFMWTVNKKKPLPLTVPYTDV